MDAAEGGDASPFPRFLTPVVPRGSDIACVVPALGMGVPMVAVGAPFKLEHVDWLDALSMTHRPAQPIAAGFADADPDGFKVHMPATAFVVWDGADIIDSTVVFGRVARSVGLFSPDFDQTAYEGPDAGRRSYAATRGAPFTVIAYVRSAELFPLAGSISCDFASADPERLAVEAQGIVATLTPLEEGEVTVTATCLGLTSAIQVQIGAPPPDDSGEDASGPDGAVEGGVGDATDGSDEGDAQPSVVGGG
jgi:hypothetical protein